ncbi:putative transporter [Cyphellophora attinorum]|uniref:Putative transporter n=1 Tax=Cyphellophora attinorum TaxID=1664694 RepID=A0A0N1NXF5_9EURO|nr:putative transporter [Phialophora attinorum]KPI34825.1 putative transporter [Phialophora attinorum]
MPAGPVSETTSLLRKPSLDLERPDVPIKDAATAGSDGYDTVIDESVSESDYQEDDTAWQTEVKYLVRNSPFLIVTYMVQYSFSVVTVLVAGRLGTKELAAASLASMNANVFGYNIYEGLATSLDTLTSQAYGNGKKELVGLAVQRMCALMCLVTIPIGAVWLSAPWILPALVPEKEVAKLAGRFLQIYLIGAPSWGIFEASKRFMQAQGKFDASLWVLLVCAPVNIFLNWLLPFRLGLGFEGAALATAISNTLQPVVLILYIWIFDREALQCWPTIQWRRIFSNWGPIIRLSIPGVVMTAAEWFAFDALTFASSYLSAEHLAAQSVVMTVCVAIYHVPFPVSIVASTRFGHWIGYGALNAARKAWRTFYVVFCVIGLWDLVLLTSTRHLLAQLFTKDESVRDIIVLVLPIVASAQLFDALLAISNGLLRGLGRQSIGGWVNLGVYYIFGLPLSFFLTFGPPKLELQGLWVGPTLGLGLGAFMMWLYMKTANWEKCVEDARAREE